MILTTNFNNIGNIYLPRCGKLIRTPNRQNLLTSRSLNILLFKTNVPASFGPLLFPSNSKSKIFMKFGVEISELPHRLDTLQRINPVKNITFPFKNKVLVYILKEKAFFLRQQAF